MRSGEAVPGLKTVDFRAALYHLLLVVAPNSRLTAVLLKSCTVIARERNEEKLLCVTRISGLVAIAPTARADQFSFSFNGGGISSSGILTVSPSSTPGVDEITGISGKLVDGVKTLTYPFSGGQFDIFGVAFDIAGPGGYVAELWSNGDVGHGPIVYAAGLANATGLVDNPNAVPGPGVPPPGGMAL